MKDVKHRPLHACPSLIWVSEIMEGVEQQHRPVSYTMPSPLCDPKREADIARYFEVR